MYVKSVKQNQPKFHPKINHLVAMLPDSRITCKYIKIRAPDTVRGRYSIEPRQPDDMQKKCKCVFINTYLVVFILSD